MLVLPLAARLLLIRLRVISSTRNCMCYRKTPENAQLLLESSHDEAEAVVYDRLRHTNCNRHTFQIVAYFQFAGSTLLC